MNLLEEFAKIGLPILGAALPVPGGAAIGGMLASMIGAPDSTPGSILDTIKNDAAKLQQATQFQMTHEETLVKLAADAEATRINAETSDRQSARQLAIGTKAWTPGVLSWFIVLGFFVLNGYLIRFGNPTGLDDVILGRILGTLDTAFGVVLSFWLGTSFSSRNKDDTIQKIATGPGN